MNTYERFLSALLSEFKRGAQPQVRSLWADLMELAEATEERALFAAHEQALRRIRVLRRAAGAANAGQVQSRSQVLELRLRALTPAPAATRPELFEGLYGSMRELVRAHCSIDAEAPISENANQPTEALLIESCAN